MTALGSKLSKLELLGTFSDSNYSKDLNTVWVGLASSSLLGGTEDAIINKLTRGNIKYIRYGSERRVGHWPRGGSDAGPRRALFISWIQSCISPFCRGECTCTKTSGCVEASTFNCAELKKFMPIPHFVCSPQATKLPRWGGTRANVWSEQMMCFLELIIPEAWCWVHCRDLDSLTLS